MNNPPVPDFHFSEKPFRVPVKVDENGSDFLSINKKKREKNCQDWRGSSMNGPSMDRRGGGLSNAKRPLQYEAEPSRQSFDEEETIKGGESKWGGGWQKKEEEKKLSDVHTMTH